MVFITTLPLLDMSRAHLLLSLSVKISPPCPYLQCSTRARDHTHASKPRRLTVHDVVTRPHLPSDITMDCPLQSLH
ncbi:hypothetical protein BDQ17DRAFT_1340261 [Cyathus striatus]|nr:hypothetical protein BDQ17DRAFT_1340261 [Cyathus striatus]